jgi:hypothetical protein
MSPSSAAGEVCPEKSSVCENVDLECYPVLKC